MSPMVTSLSTRLIESGAFTGSIWHSEGEGADAARAVFAAWLRDLANVQQSPEWITALHLAAMEAERSV